MSVTIANYCTEKVNQPLWSLYAYPLFRIILLRATVLSELEITISKPS